MPHSENTKERRDPISLSVEYSPNHEEERIAYTLNKYAWFQEQGYSLSFPAGLQEQLAHPDHITSEDIRSAVAEEYDETVYKAQEAALTNGWEQEQDAFSTFLRSLHLPTPTRVHVLFTRYGVGGSYEVPQTIIINIAKTKYAPIDTLRHESIHLVLEPLIQHHHIAHWSKERIVDMTTAKYTGAYRPQDEPENAQRITEAFEKYYPNMPEVIAHSA